MEAEISIHKQIGLNLTKGGKINSEEEFLFSENLFSIAQEDNLEKFQNAFRMQSKKLAEKYDDSTAVVMSQCGYKVGDQFPEVRGLMHIKNEIEQQVFNGKNASMVVVLWSQQYKELNEFLEFIDNLAHEKKVK